MAVPPPAPTAAAVVAEAPTVVEPPVVLATPTDPMLQPTPEAEVEVAVDSRAASPPAAPAAAATS
ncbi:MAG: hypothetical protein COT71_02265 [Candidatus Andersenbacteria bacterium CG10_big_fil_rev_8_21_14_0_10_54_11]|uniref:Uncharacterized protein n=1 Tax=Candidatus Andersenbacteria bacterium CG10_big_fil_rev_8_21_14_0_10_54_11 TaxID=1974485 RepID=A0A2M6WZI1_9BACT|nr:MAG: hypothetical protein COT71_02265 [Candidatus Andersenbacteria bacterium CG10_big_fil_rev_8_21_14_0_10_54_11]